MAVGRATISYVMPMGVLDYLEDKIVMKRPRIFTQFLSPSSPAVSKDGADHGETTVRVQRQRLTLATDDALWFSSRPLAYVGLICHIL